VNARAEHVGDERAWLLRALLVLQSPTTVFRAMRDDSTDTARSLEEAVLALVLLAGIASVLWTPVAGRLMDDPAIDGLLVAVWAFIGGGIYGVAVYWAAGAALWAGTRVLGSPASYRLARHVVAFAAAPLALSLVLVWPVRLSIYGGDVFRSGGSDAGGGAETFAVLEFGFAVWALALLVLGVRIVYGWAWPRATAAVVVAAAVPAAIALLTRI
jgi:hypothetical protein